MSYSSRIPYRKAYRLDVEAIVYQSLLNPAPRRDPLAAVLVAAKFTSRSGFDRDSYCRQCGNWDQVRSTRNSTRPVGTFRRDSCNGCLLGAMEPTGVSLSEVRDRLFSRWAEATANVRDLVALRPISQTPDEKAELRQRINAAKQVLSVVLKACRLAGFDPIAKQRKTGRRSQKSQGGLEPVTCPGCYLDPLDCAPGQAPVEVAPGYVKCPRCPAIVRTEMER